MNTLLARARLVPPSRRPERMAGDPPWIVTHDFVFNGSDYRGLVLVPVQRDEPSGTDARRCKAGDSLFEVIDAASAPPEIDGEAGFLRVRFRMPEMPAGCGGMLVLLWFDRLGLGPIPGDVLMDKRVDLKLPGLVSAESFGGGIPRHVLPQDDQEPQPPTDADVDEVFAPTGVLRTRAVIWR